MASAEPKDDEPKDAVPDGRALRGARNRERILQAIYALIADGHPRPSAEHIARRAGVGVRTVFRHFQDMERLHVELIARVTALHEPLFGGEPAQGALDARVGRFVRRRVAALERIAPFKRSGDLLRWRSPELEKEATRFARFLRRDLERALPEVTSLSGAQQEALHLACSFETWDRLRVGQRLSRERAQAAVEASVGRLLEARDVAVGRAGRSAAHGAARYHPPATQTKPPRSVATLGAVEAPRRVCNGREKDRRTPR